MTTDALNLQAQDTVLYLARRIARLEFAVDDLVGESGLAFSSIEADDGSFDTYDVDGNLIASIDPDLGFYTEQTTYGPAQPTDPDVTGIYDALAIAWDGTFTDGDWDENQIDHVEIHAVAASGDPLDDTNQVGTFTSSLGGVFTYPWHALDGGRWIYLVAVDTAGAEGIPSDGVFAVPDVVAPTDGVPPATSPAVALKGGIKAVFASWTPTPNNDPVVYDVYIRDNADPTSDPIYLIATTPGTSIGLNSFVGGAPITPTDVAHVMVVARDADGEGPDGAVATASPITIDTVDVTALAITTALIGPSAIATGNIQANAITSALIAAGAIQTSDIGASQITNTLIAASAITSSLIADGTIATGDIGADQITSALIAAATIQTSDIGLQQITAGLITDGTITTAKIGSQQITTTTIADNAITTIKIAANQITATQLSAGSVTANKLSVIVGGGNLLLNSSFENTALTSWAQYNQVVMTSGASPNGKDGGAYAIATATAVVADSGIVQNYSVTSGLTYTLSTWVRNPGAAVINARLRFAGVGMSGNTAIAVPADNTWRRYSLTATATASGVANIRAIEFYTGGSTSGVLHIDQAQFEEGDVATAYSPKPDEILPGTIVAAMIAASTITAGQIAAGTITAAQITSGTIVGSLIAAATITGGLIAAGTITAANISAGTITANELAAGTITVDKLLVGVGTNFVANSGFESGVMTPHVLLNGTLASMSTNVHSGNQSVSIRPQAVIPNGSYTDILAFNGALDNTTTSMPVKVGDVVYAEGWTRVNSASGAKIAVAVDALDNTGAVVATTQGSIVTVTSTYQRTSVTYTVPTGVAFICLKLQAGNITVANTSVFIDDFYMGVQVPGNLIVNGTITATNIAASTVTTNEIAANTILAADIAATTITAAQIATNTITASQIAANTITASQIAANTITAAQIAASTITTTQLSATAIDGMTITGSIFQTASSGQRMTMQNDTVAGVIKMYSGLSSDVAGYINPDLQGTSPNQIPTLTIKSPTGNGFNTAPFMAWRSGGHTASVDASVLMQIVLPTSLSGAGTTQHGALTISETLTGLIQHNFTGQGAYTAQGQIYAVGRLVSDGSYSDTTASAANAFWASDHHLARSTSLRRAKISIKAMDAAEIQAVRKIVPSTFYDKGEWTRNGRRVAGLRRIPGAIAEDVEKVAPLFVTYDNDGLNGISYDRIGVALIPLVNELYARIERLERQLA